MTTPTVWIEESRLILTSIAVVVKTAAYTAVAGNYVLADATTAPLTITLPAPTNSAIITVQKSDGSANAVVIDTVGTAKINGQDTATVSTRYGGANFVSNGVDWFAAVIDGGSTAPSAPSAPTGVVATAGAGNASIAFSVPPTNGSPITSYTVTSLPGALTSTGTVSPIVVSGLIAATAYTFTVTATNALGTSPASTASNSIVSTGNPALLDDTFDGSVDVLLTSHTPNIGSGVYTSAAPSSYARDGIGGLKTHASGEHANLHGAVQQNARTRIEFIWGTTLDRVNLGVLISALDVNNLVFAGVSAGATGTADGRVEVYVKQAGTFSLRGTFITPPIAVSTAHSIEVKRFGNVITVYFDDAVIGTYTLVAGEITALGSGNLVGVRGVKDTVTNTDNSTSRITRLTTFAATN